MKKQNKQTKKLQSNSALNLYISFTVSDMSVVLTISVYFFSNL